MDVNTQIRERAERALAGYVMDANVDGPILRVTLARDVLALLDRLETMEAPLREFVDDYDFHAAPYLYDAVDGEEARVFTARTVAALIELQGRGRAALSEDGPESDPAKTASQEPRTRHARPRP